MAAPGYRPRFVPKVDPATGPVTVKLERQALAKLGPKSKLTGEVVDPQGQPVRQARVDFEGVYNEGGGGSFGAIEGVDPLTVTDAKGEFVLTSEKPFSSLSVTVEARGLARQRFPQLESGRRHELRLAKGNAVTGRLVLGSRPVPSATVGLVGVDRSMERSIGDYAVTSDQQGRFLFPNLPAGKACFVYSLMRQAPMNGGVAPIQKFTTGADGATTDLGDLVIRPAFRLTGRVVLSDGKPLPPGIRAMLGREEAWDTLPNVDLAADGSFAFQGVPPESVGLSVNVPAYRLSLRNPSLDRLNGFSIIGRVSGDLEHLVILQEPGQFKHDWNRPSSPDDQPRDKPLRGLPPDQLPRP